MRRIFFYLGSFFSLDDFTHFSRLRSYMKNRTETQKVCLRSDTISAYRKGYESQRMFDNNVFKRFCA